ncbi:hypothetical protein ACFQ77_10085 [Streptomyces virginiae]|uniref:hypothetical protein n=1 Tax=Streptomyces virginiae TaxID=1961 RepID=UPI0036A08F32
MNQPGKPEPADEDQVTAGPLLLTFLVALPSPCPLPHRSVITKMLPGTVGGLDGMEMRPSLDGPELPSAAQGRPFVSLKFWQLRERQSGGPMHLAALTQVCAEITGKPLPDEDFADGTVDAYRSVVEMVTIQGPDRLAPQEEVLRESLTRCFDVLTDVSSMARMVLPHSPSGGRSGTDGVGPLARRNRHRQLRRRRDGRDALGARIEPARHRPRGTDRLWSLRWSAPPKPSGPSVAMPTTATLSSRPPCSPRSAIPTALRAGN